MNIVIFSSKRKKSILQKILTWGNQSHIKYQLFFTHSLSKVEWLLEHNKYTLIITTEKTLLPHLKKYKNVVYMKNDWKINHDN